MQDTTQTIDAPVVRHDKARRAVTYTWERPEVPSRDDGGVRVVELVTYWHKGAKTYATFLRIFDRYNWGTSVLAAPGWGMQIAEAPIPRHSVKAQREFAAQALADVLRRRDEGDQTVTALLAGLPASL